MDSKNSTEKTDPSFLSKGIIIGNFFGLKRLNIDVQNTKKHIKNNDVGLQ